jgi:hypothetical protein
MMDGHRKLLNASGNQRRPVLRYFYCVNVGTIYLCHGTKEGSFSTWAGTQIQPPAGILTDQWCLDHGPSDQLATFILYRGKTLTDRFDLSWVTRV